MTDINKLKKEVEQEEQELLNDPDFQDLVKDLETEISKEDQLLIDEWIKKHPEEAKIYDKLASKLREMLAG